MRYVAHIDGLITRVSTQQLDPEAGEAIVTTELDPDWHTHEVVGDEVVLRAEPLPDRAAVSKAEIDSLRDAILADPIARALLTRSPADIFQAVEDRVTDLASAKELLKRLAAVCAYLIQR